MKTIIASLCLITFGCTKATVSAEGSSSGLSRSADTSVQSPIRGYAHSLDRSRYVPGGALTRISDQGYSKVIGSDGVFAVDEVNGSAAAVPNASITAYPRPPYPGIAQDHHAAALKYFLAVGLPPEQIGPVQVTTEMRGGQAVTGPRPTDTFVGYSSIITRQVRGVPVDDSFATVTLDVDGQVVSEHVYWPDLPASLTQELNAFAALQTSTIQFAAFKQSVDARAPGYGSSEGMVVIHHRRWTERGTPYCRATYDSRAGARRIAARHFNVDGSEEIFVRQYPVVPATPRPR